MQFGMAMTSNGVAATSKKAYREIQEEGKVGAQCQQVLDSMPDGVEMSRNEIKHASGLPINCVTGRVNELLQVGLLTAGPTRKCRITNRTVTTVIKS